MIKRVRLGSVLESRPSESVERDSVYAVAGVYSFGRGLFVRHILSGNDTKYQTFTRLKTDDVVYSKLGAFEGAVAVAEEAFDGHYVSPEFPVFSTSGDAEPSFLRHYLSSTLFMEQLQAATTGIGARQKRVPPTAFLKLTFPRPPVVEQRRIAAHLNTFEERSRRLDAVSMARRSAIASFTGSSWGGEVRRIRELVEQAARPVSVADDATYRMLGVRWYGQGVFV